MNNIAVISNNNLTMSSREIAELCEKRHDNVLKLIRELIAGGVLKNTRPQNYVHSQNNQEYTEFLSDKRDSLVIVARLSPEFTAAVVDRWQELENYRQQSTALTPSRKELALMVIQAEEEKERLQLENLQMKPKADFVDQYVDVGTSKSLRETAKILRMSEKAMIAKLIDNKALFRQSDNLLPYADKLSKGLFTVKTGTTDHGHNFTQTRVTGKGIQWIASRYASELMA
ncbi:Phage antirepressor protein YoqD, KilAC domain [Pasteurella testudinis DSM 23072]|uniref:Phage antirepressor protein YoqD, KilAC domain n=1 Tax=Pasteurella testudinis DSM 23072 TaxID=1122938 RepID=A0A1W1V3X4_9PAST|nr:phage antirepressor KilAC domain-containing protein [Pasteurella testudinis]SMB88018.1 Phage antirepressor protein YoqD, KilAC domain [Pasteurella testudinis DSM 23072]SUB51609.1 putative DNA-binding protein (Roi) [Pasteurella testudinis]